MGSEAGERGATSTRSQRPRRYDKDLVRDRMLELLTARLGTAREQGARVVWDCPACGKREKYSVVKASGKGGCLVADCRLAGSGDVFVMLASLEDLDYKADFLAVLTRSYELLGMEPADSCSDPRGRSQHAARSGANGTGNEESAPNAEARDENRIAGPANKGAHQTGAGPRAVPVGRRTEITTDPSGGLEDLDVRLEFAARAYERILEICPLETRDRRYLKTRGLSSATIRRGRFGTMTAPRAGQVKARLQRELGREALLSVPGFSEDEETGLIKWTLTGNYVLIPYHDARGRVTTIEGRVVGEPTDGRKYVTLRRAGNHLYLFPGHRPEDLVAVCEGAMGAIVAAECGITVGAIMGCERFRASLSPEMLDGAPGEPLLELKGADFAGRTLPYIPDADDPPNPNVLRAAPKAARWIAEPQNAEAAVCLLPKGVDLDEWLLSIGPKERDDRFAELLAGTSPPEDNQSLPRPPASRADAGETKKKTDAPTPGPKDTRGLASAHAAEVSTSSSAGPSPQSLDHKKNVGSDDGSYPGRGRVLTEEDVRRDKGGAKTSKAKTSKKSSRKGAATDAAGEGSQPGLWDAPDLDDKSLQTAGRGVSRGARKLRDEVYRALIEKLPPKEEHLLALEKQGLMRATAKVGRFASLDAGAATKAVSDLAERFGAKRLLTVPGFEAYKGNNIRLCPTTGRAEEHILIPCFDVEGLLAGVEGLPFDPKSGELDAEETVPLKGAGSHLYVFAHYSPGEVEGFCEGPLGAMLAAQEDVVVGAIGGFRRYRAASGPGEGRQAAEAVLPELEGVDLADRRLAYVPRSTVGESNARYHEAPEAARWLVERQGGDPSVVGLACGEDPAENGRDGPTSLGAWIGTLSDEEAHDRLREIFPESSAREEADVSDSVEVPDAAKAPADEPVPPLPTKAILVCVAVAAVLGLALGAILLRLRDFAGHVSTTPAGEPVLYPDPLGSLRRLADAAPFRILYDFYPVVVALAVLGFALLLIAKARARHLVHWRSSRLRLKERWELHKVPEGSRHSAALFTRGEALWGVLAWSAGYLLAGWLLAVLEGILGLAASLGMTPGVGPLVPDPGPTSLYAATALSVFVLWRRRSMRSAEARMLAGKIRH
ncbi:hypothetical protein GBA63_19650 [Rubrobacter tropicus]|uniref:Uncharacterized protein n=1 Tax=Rubrobacter tropicus TaxID=2653851 RepID=A0A6G8QDN7_9ACTN|nr:hypothetical protein [Rubrobacter tropicus]QIN84615.1 hypothetical protein GBA63_19650 [Rubrobacter tropicus]